MSDRALVLAALMIASALASPGPARAQPAHPAVRYSCMSEPSDGSGWPWVGEGVPEAIERQHPGYEISRYDAFTLPGLSLFVIGGTRRRPPAPERYASVEAVDESGAFVGGRELFVRAAASTTDPTQLARYAMAFLLRRADERPLRGSTPDLSELIRDRVSRPWLDGATLYFWVRADSASPYAALVRVELATGVHTGDAF